MDPELSRQVPISRFAKDRGWVQGWAVVSHHWCGKTSHYVKTQAFLSTELMQNGTTGDS